MGEELLAWFFTRPGRWLIFGLCLGLVFGMSAVALLVL